MSEADSGLLKGLKETIGEKLDKVSDIKDSVTDKISDIKDSVTDKISDIKDSTEENAGIAKELASYQGSNMKSEGQFLKKIFQHKDMVFKKTDAVAIVLRKLGGNEEFFELVDKLTKEGYRMVHQESVRNIPLGFGFNYPLGSLYYFQHVKYIGKT
ncbi:MAG: hypothetical protein ACREBI_09535 [Nitrosotalea sp.]